MEVRVQWEFWLILSVSSRTYSTSVLKDGPNNRSIFLRLWSCWSSFAMAQSEQNSHYVNIFFYFQPSRTCIIVQRFDAFSKNSQKQTTHNSKQRGYNSKATLRRRKSSFCFVLFFKIKELMYYKIDVNGSPVDRSLSVSSGLCFIVYKILSEGKHK